jgi:hypothetical protein
MQRGGLELLTRAACEAPPRMEELNLFSQNRGHFLSQYSGRTYNLCYVKSPRISFRPRPDVGVVVVVV